LQSSGCRVAVLPHRPMSPAASLLLRVKPSSPKGATVE
jgi:hypothetical protein